MNIEIEKEKNNWLIRNLFIRKEFEKCKEVIEKQLKICPLSEYATFTKALIYRQDGKIIQSLRLFEATIMLNPRNGENLKQLGRSYFLLGSYKDAFKWYNKAQVYAPDDWEIWHNKGLCKMQENRLKDAEDCFVRANAIQKHDETFMELGKVYRLQDRWQDAIDCYSEALEYSPENPEICTTLGLLYLRVGENFHAFNQLGNSLALQPTSPKTILAAGSIMQDHSEMDVALNKYRVAVKQTPNSAQLWNNIGICFFGKRMLTEAKVCLKRALNLSPFEWTILYNLGIVHLKSEQYASAFHFLSSSLSLKQDYAKSYMHLAIALEHLDDFTNACNAFERALKMERSHLIELNYSVCLYNAGKFKKAKHHFDMFCELLMALDEETRGEDMEIIQRKNEMKKMFEKVKDKL